MWMIIIIVVLILIWMIATYNKLQSMMQNIREQLSNLQAAFKKRIDLSNQIIEIAAGYSEHEKLTYMTVTKSSDALKQMVALSQAYPDLKANQTYQTLMSQLESLEETVLARRERYNEKVRKYNSFRNNFPNVLIASRLNFDVAPFFEIEDPDFANKMKVFQRDDTQALQALLNSGIKSVQSSAEAAKQKVSSKVQAATNENEMQHEHQPDEVPETHKDGMKPKKDVEPENDTP